MRRSTGGGAVIAVVKSLSGFVAAVFGLLVLFFVAMKPSPSLSVEAEMASPRFIAESPAATPIPDADVRPDPLDGDPLDGPLPDDPDRQNQDLVKIPIARSGRPASAPDSLPAYDGDPTTVWAAPAEVGETWIWFDLGELHPLRKVRFLASGTGAVQVELSRDRRKWNAADALPIRSGWQEVDLRQDARYVRLTIAGDDDGAPPNLMEVAAYGLREAASVTREQRVDDDGSERQRDRDREERDRESSRREALDRGNDGQGDASPGISAEPGETRCNGKRAKCKAREGRVSVEDDCQREGTCVIDIQADGGAAICDASGPDGREAGDGEGKRGGDGGRCEAVANGGAVTIGDINP